MIFFLIYTLSTFAFEIPGAELVVTQPVETTLVNEDIRGPVEVWKEMIDGAQKQIDLEHMYASGKAGEPLDEVIERLEAAAYRGVKIRMLLEENMKRASVSETLDRLQKIKGLELRYIKFSEVSGDGIIHTKAMVIDGGRLAFVGSQNFDYRALKHIQETGIKISEKKIAAEVQSIFDQDWKAAGLWTKKKKVPPVQKKPILSDGKSNFYLVASPFAYNPKGVKDSEQELLRLIGEAKEEIRISLLDYYPLNRDKSFYAPIDNAIRAAQARKVKIRLLVSHWNTSKPGVDHLKSLSVLPGVEVKIATIPQAKEGFIPFARVNHSKYMTIDNKIAWVGTSNWTGGYLDKSRNIEIVMKNEEMAKRLSALHDQLWQSPYSAALELTKDYPKVNKGGE
jgi:phosphatidylserine/phosphatidylglycerophosphate/cardiolipin synthase-like enzyme